MPEFKSEFSLPFSVATVFDFHATPANLIRLIPSDDRVQLVEAPPLLIQGSEFELKLSSFGFVQHIRFRITQYQSPDLMTDEQIKGPFKMWRQTHRLEPTAGGGTRLIHQVQFEPPGGMLGLVVTAKRILTELEHAVPMRQKRTLDLLAEMAAGK